MPSKPRVMKRPRVALLALLLGACHAGAPLEQAPQPNRDDGGEFAPLRKATLPPLPAEPAPPPSARENEVQAKDLPKLIERHFEHNIERRFYLQVDKPLYQPGETIWFKTWDLTARGLSGAAGNQTTVELISPKGAAVMKLRLQVSGGSAANAFDLPAEAQGGEYLLRATAGDGRRSERAVIVSAYEAPRMKKKLEFVKKAYGAGDAVGATVEVKRPTGEALAGKEITAVITVDGAELPRVKAITNADGGALVKFDLPKAIESGEGLLTVLMEDGGVTESISKSIPILQKKLSLAFYPEGGKMVAGLPTRLYFEAKNLIGKPADVDGRVVDDLGNPVANFSSYKNGLGRIEFTPATGRSYRAEITRPSTVTEKYALPLADDKGCVLRSYDDLDGQQAALRVAVRCSEQQKVVVAATLRENMFDVGAVEAGPAAAGVIYLNARDAAMQQAAGVALAITTKDAAGKPVPAELALSVVDDTVLSFADDKSGHLLSKLLLEPELPGKIEEPNFYLDLTEAKSALAMDLLMGARGYRRFDWMPVLQPAQSVASGLVDGLPMPMAASRARRVESPPAPAARPRAKNVLREAVMQNAPAMAQRADALAPRPMAVRPAERAIAEDKDFARAAMKKAAPMREELAWAPVRVFPLPAFTPGYAGPRNDYRETVLWAPSIKTDQYGKASVKFVLSDAVTSFRVLSEGVGGGAAGRDETVFKSSLPFSLSAKLPLEVSAGDKPLIPVTLTNDSESALDVVFDADFGALLKAGAKASGGALAAGQRKSLFIPLDVTGTRGQSEVRLSAASAGLRDEVLRRIPVAAPGFPQLFEKAGQIKGEVTHELDLGKATPGSVQAAVKIYTSPLSTMISGLEGMLREPSGCFEQTSSTNYPNVMIMQYMRAHDVADSALLEKTGKLLDNGYKKLAGFESPKKGYEWFGGDPGHEALTAYGLLEFADMKDVYGSVDGAMLARTGAWLKSRRDGNGGYQRDVKALDSFGRAAPEVTDAYITWALVAAGESGLEREIGKTVKLAETTQDAYLLALAAGTLLERGAGGAAAQAGRKAAARLAQMQDASGAWTHADHSITRSGGLNLQIETTALAVMALLKADGQLEAARKGIDWLQNNRGGFGQWGATQATVLALKAMIAFDNATRVAPKAGAVTLLVDGVVVAEQAYDAGRREPLLFTGFDQRLGAGKHRITLRSKNGDPLPYSIAVEYRTGEPASSSAAAVSLQATLAKSEIKMGETVRLDATVANKTQAGQPMTLARLGIPGGLAFQNWQLKELREQGRIAFFETRAREVILYFRDLKPGEVKQLGIDLVAAVPGSYTGPASSAYLYYNDSDKSWAAPLAIRIAP